MPPAARLLPAVIAAVLTSTLVGGGVAAADLRADERRAQAERERIAAAERLARDEEAYRVAVRPLAEELYDQVQPLQEAADRVVRAEDASFTVLSDVSKGGGAAGLADVRGRLAAVVPPPTFAQAHRTLDAGMEQLTQGADAMLFSIDPDLDDRSFFREFTRGDRALDKGVRIVAGELGTLFSGQAVPSLPAETSAPRAARPPVGKAAYLSAVGGVCAPSPAEVSDDARGLRLEAQQLRGLLDALIAVPAPPVDAALLRTSVVEPLERSRTVPDGLEGAAGALDRRDERAFVAARLAVERGSQELQEVGRGFAAYGSETCKLALVGGEEGEDGPPEERPA